MHNFKMIGLVKGTRYYVKGNPIYPRSLRSFECYEEDTVWVTTMLDIRVYLQFYTFYRYVSKKVKEKYDATCLNIILKRLINDDFHC
jgi:hypothetical protein